MSKVKYGRGRWYKVLRALDGDPNALTGTFTRWAWKPGQVNKELGQLKRCQRGLHITRQPLRWIGWFGKNERSIWLCKPIGKGLYGSDKAVFNAVELDELPLFVGTSQECREWLHEMRLS